MQDLKITLIQSDLHWEDVGANLAMFEEKIWQIGESTDVIVLPEMFTTGFSMKAAHLAEGLARISGISIPYGADTNIVIFRVPGAAADWVESFRKHGILCGTAIAHDEVRMVTHLDADLEGFETAIAAAGEISREIAR